MDLDEQGTPAGVTPLPDRALGEHPGALAGLPVDWAALHRVLVVRPDNAGDVVMLGPALRQLRAACPEAHVTLLTSPAGAPAADLLAEVDDVLVASPTWQHAGVAPAPDPAAELELVERVRAGAYDAAVLFTSFSQSPWPPAYVALLAGIPVRLGMSKEFGGALLSTWVPAPEDGLHQVDRAVHLLSRLGLPEPDGTDLRVVVSEAAREQAAAALGATGPYAVVLPGASCSSRRWPAARFRELGGLLTAEGLHVVVAGTPKERALVEAATPAGGTALVGALGLDGLAALLEGAALAVTNNSGGMHLADAVRVPLVALFAGTEEEGQYAPRSTRAAVLRVPTACSPCRAFTCPFTGQTPDGAPPCLDLDPRAVAAAALALTERSAA
ncbi:ADP-heptose:LPS heptosyltransferase [Motilibacter rhizosphaerae]|uniref:ADP-heptose:LPS heptosyltransferase n=1 Tax=Motilibacter rhizosphaerae TaxID=598652 RepID=A0A4Q7NW79_9ACTN|nr:glycosyltransferase family 9 protein [Motilibacter rhizosphaerae]RZS91531.1 ADP-heptose:LPS heptosyltransferase [Motilibacter rhizosphaerae]